MPTTNIIDISYAQPVAAINWGTLKANGIAALIRAGQATYEDNLFRQHYAGAVNAGAMAGMYWFYQPDMRPEYQSAACISVWDSLAVKPKVIAVDVEPIVYTGVSIYPPSAATHTVWLQAWLDAVEAATGIIPMIYTRADYWDVWTLRKTTWARYPLWIASWTNYSANIRMPLDWQAWRVWQYEGGTGRTEGVTGPVDQNTFNGTKAELVTFFGGKETNLTTANIHNTAVALGERAWIMEVKPDCKVTAGFKSLGVDALVLPMVNSVWDGSHQRVLPEPTFAGRFDEAAAAGIPVFGLVTIDAGIVTIEQHTQLELDGHTVWQNLVVPKILDAWHIGPWTQGNLKPADFRPIKAIIFEQTTEIGFKGADIGDFWQAHFFRYVVDKFRVLVEAGAIPDVPIILKTGRVADPKDTRTWLQKYSSDYAVMLQDGRKSWLYLALTDNKQLTSTGSFADLWSIYKYATWNDYSYPYVPDGYAERVVLFEFTAGDQVMAFTSGNQKAYLSKWCDTAAALTEFIGGEPAEPPTPPPPDEITALKARVTALESRMAAAEVKIMKLTGEISEPTLQAQLNALIENLHKV